MVVSDRKPAETIGIKDEAYETVSSLVFIRQEATINMLSRNDL